MAISGGGAGSTQGSLAPAFFATKSTCAVTTCKMIPHANAISMGRKELSPPGKPDWRVVGILLTGTFLAVLDFFIVNVAIPDLQRDLNASAALLSPQILAILSSLYEGTAMAPALNAYGLCMGMASVFSQVRLGLAELLPDKSAHWPGRDCPCAPNSSGITRPNTASARPDGHDRDFAGIVRSDIAADRRARARMAVMVVAFDGRSGSFVPGVCGL